MRDTIKRRRTLGSDRHEHRRSLWIICGGLVIWCYRCGAWRMNDKESRWHQPTGLNGANPATRKGWEP